VPSPGGGLGGFVKIQIYGGEQNVVEAVYQFVNKAVCFSPSAGQYPNT